MQHGINKNIPRISAALSFKDYWGAIKVRLGVQRHNYKVTPGLYAVGSPNEDSNVLVTANYKLSFDSLRKHLNNISCWLLVLDTKGINVWCAAGKGTFGTEELINKIQESNLKEIIRHKKIILPQLGAVGVNAYEIKKQTGFSVIYGPVRAKDIPEFLNNGLETTKEMKRVHFTFIDRLVLTPNEFLMSFKYILLAGIIFLVVSNLGIDAQKTEIGIYARLLWVIGLFIAYFCGTILGPVLLPFLPGRSFSLKGFWLGIAAAGLFVFISKTSYLESISLALMMSAITSFLLMNFTGSSTYTSISGVLKEMKIAMPLQIIGCTIGIIIFIITRFI
ncbi:mercury methylation corrinoid protein HgcA [Candidatus Margulisiibacteriota bacterium]